MFRPLSIFNRSQHEPAAAAPLSSDPFFRLQHEMNRLFDETFAGFAPTSGGRAIEEFRSPRIDLHETGDSIEVEAELPGVDEKNLDVQIADNLLTIRGEKRVERKEEKEGQYRMMERAFGSFSRSITLPCVVDPDAVEATFKNGVLTLRLPKPPEVQTLSKRIAIKAA